MRPEGLAPPRTPHESKTARAVTSLKKSFVLNHKAVLAAFWMLPDTEAAMVLSRVLTALPRPIFYNDIEKILQ